MRVKKRRTPKDLCVFVGLFLIIFVTIFHILLFGHTRASSYHNHNASYKNIHQEYEKTNNIIASRKIAEHTLADSGPVVSRVPSSVVQIPTVLKVTQRTLAVSRPVPVVSRVPSSVVHRPTVIKDTKPRVRADFEGNPQLRFAEIELAGRIPHTMIASRARTRSMVQAELKKMEKSLAALVRQNAPSPEVSAHRFRSESSWLRLKNIITEAEQKAQLYAPLKKNATLHGILGIYNGANPQNSVVISQGEQQQQQQQQLDRHPGKHKLSELEHHNLNDFDTLKVVKNALVENVQVTVNSFANDGVIIAEDGVRLLDDDIDESNDDKNNVSRDSLEEYGPDHQRICKAVPETLEGVTQDLHLDIEVDIEKIISAHLDIAEGGEWKPDDCVSRSRLAIIIPYRDRWSHLKVLLHYLLPLLKRQQIHFRIFVVEQHGNQTFNKGRIMNAAYREALKLFEFTNVIFHDVDLVPEDDRNIYSCSENPKHMSTAIDKFDYHLPYQGLVGGVLCFRVDHFQLVNGYSNMYWGWGGEDDDMTTRILSKGLRIFRPPNNVARYKMVKHGGRSQSVIRLKLLKSAARRGRVEGLNNVPYKLLFTHSETLFTHFMVDVGEP